MELKYESFRKGNHVRIGQAKVWKEISSISGEANGEKRYGLKGEEQTYSESEICGITLLEEVVSKGKKWRIEFLGFKKNNDHKEIPSDTDISIDFYYHNKLVWKYIERRKKVVNEETFREKKDIWVSESESIIELWNENRDSSQPTIKFSIKYVHSLQNFLSDNPKSEYGVVDFYKIYEENK